MTDTGGGRSRRVTQDEIGVRAGGIGIRVGLNRRLLAVVGSLLPEISGRRRDRERSHAARKGRGDLLWMIAVGVGRRGRPVAADRLLLQSLMAAVVVGCTVANVGKMRTRRKIGHEELGDGPDVRKTEWPVMSGEVMKGICVMKVDDVRRKRRREEHRFGGEI
jgi:hypothetical protein